MFTISLTERQAYLLTLMLQDLHNGDLVPEDGITQYPNDDTHAIEQRLYDAGVDSELVYEKAA